MPPHPPLHIGSRLESFDKEFCGIFVKKKAKLNISKFQEGLVESLCSDDFYITATADKGFGPVRIELPCYIKDGLVHRSNTKTYQIISEDQDRREILDLKWEIFESIL